MQGTGSGRSPVNLSGFKITGSPATEPDGVFGKGRNAENPI
jgi:hypothetical protein